MRSMKHKRRKQVSRPTRGYNGHLYDSQLEAAVSMVLEDQIKPLGGYHHGAVEFAIKYQASDGSNRWYVPDWQVMGHPKILIEAKARVDQRSRSHLTAALKQGYRIGVVFPNPRASELPLFQGADLSMGQWLQSHGIAYVTSPEGSLELLEQLISTETAISKEEIK